MCRPQLPFLAFYQAARVTGKISAKFEISATLHGLLKLEDYSSAHGRTDGLYAFINAFCNTVASPLQATMINYAR